MTQNDFKLSNSLFLMFAALPVMLELSSMEAAGIIGTLVCLAWWLTRLVFRLLRPLFPERLFKSAIIFWVAALGQIAWYHLHINPLWVGSLVFILFYEGIEKRLFGDSWAKTIKFGLQFILLLFFIQFMEILLGILLAVPSFHHSFGLLLILGFLAVFVRKRNLKVSRG